MRRAFLAALLLVAAAPAETLPPPPPGGVIVSADGRIVISAWVCAELSGPLSGVPGPDYVPGVDAEGRAVTPADLPGGAPPVWLGDVPIEIDADLQKRFGIAADSKLFRGKDIAGLVIVRDNRAYFNGEPIGENEQAAMAAACREHGF